MVYVIKYNSYLERVKGCYLDIQILYYLSFIIAGFILAIYNDYFLLLTVLMLIVFFSKTFIIN